MVPTSAPPGSSPPVPPAAGAAATSLRATAGGSAGGAYEAIVAEAAVSELVFGTTRASELFGAGIEHVEHPGQAIDAALAAARAGKRAGVLLAPAELVASLEALAAAAAARAPIVVHVAGGGQGTVRGRDELAPALDVGAGVLVTWTAQEAADVTVAVRRAAEDSETPFLLVHDVAPGSEPEPFALPGAALIRDFLGPARAASAALQDDDRAGAVRRKRAERSFATRVPFALAGALRELGDRTGRPLAPIERYQTADADEIIVTVGAAFLPARAVAASLRSRGRRVGVIGLRALRPFFATEIVKAASRAGAMVVLEPLDLPLAPCGPTAALLKAAFADALTWAPGFPGVGRIPPIVSATFATIDGLVGERDVRAALDEIATGERARRILVFGSES